MTDELTWDYTGDESSPLLQRSASPFYSGERNVVNRRQARYILHNINEVSRILQTGLGREQFADVPTTIRGVNADDETMRGRLSALVTRLTNVIYRHRVQYIPVILVICLVIAVVVESIYDGVASSSTQHLPYVACVMCGVTVLLLALIYFILVRQAVDYRVSLGTVAISFFCSVAVFALLYLVCLRFNSFSMKPSVVVSSAEQIFIAQYCQMLEFSVSIFTLCPTGRYDAAVWYTRLILALQMLLSYCHLLFSATTLLSHLYVSTSLGPSTVAANPALRQTARYDPDNESLGPPYDLHAVGSGNRDDGPAASRRHDNGCHGSAAEPTQIPPNQTTADVLVASDNLYQSNSV